MAVYRHGVTYDVGIASRSRANAEAGARALLMFGEQSTLDRLGASVRAIFEGGDAVQLGDAWVVSVCGWEPYRDVGGDALIRAWGVPERVAPDFNVMTLRSQGTTLAQTARTTAAAAQARVTDIAQIAAATVGTAAAIPAAVMVGGAVLLAVLAFVWLRGGAPGAKVLVSAAKGG